MSIYSKGTIEYQFPVILNNLANGRNYKEILENYSSLQFEDIQAVLAHATLLA
ncbi:MAG: DUF433 domain-containing protein [Dethiobacter sp.]|nr:MAG: DUF433 domain-containing protein [Dethiobacter sp.]